MAGSAAAANNCLSAHRNRNNAVGSSGFAARLSTQLRTTLWLFRKYMNGGRSGPRSFDQRFREMWKNATRQTWPRAVLPEKQSPSVYVVAL